MSIKRIAAPRIAARTGIFCAAALALALGARGASASELVVEIDNMKQANGMVRLGLYDNAQRFPKPRGAIGGGEVRVEGDKVVHVFRNLKPGRYAVALYHDANANNRFDRTAIGLPKEGFGFSNNVKPGLSAPSFASAAVRVIGPRTRIRIRLQHW